MRKFACSLCSHVYDEAEGDPVNQIPPGTKWEDVPDEWLCPECGAAKSDYVEID